MWDPIGGSTPSKPFCFLMDASMLGYVSNEGVNLTFSFTYRVGVGFDCRGASGDPRSVVYGPDELRKPIVYEIPDSREGWVESLKLLIDSYFITSPPMVCLLCWRR